MNKIMLIIIMLFMAFNSLYSAEKIKIIEPCKARDGYAWRTSEQIDKMLQVGEEYTILDVFGDYVKVEIVKGQDAKSTSDHIGKIGYISSSGLYPSNKPGDTIVTGEGWTLRSSPDKDNNGTPADTADDPNFLAKVKAGAAAEIIEVTETWYKIGKSLWVSYTHVEEIK